MRIERVPVELASGDVCRPVTVWSGTRTQTADRLFPSFDAYPRRPKAIEHAAGTRWRSEHVLPIGGGAVVTTTRGREPTGREVFLATAADLEALGYDAAWDLLDPARAADRAAQREHDRRADEAGLPRDLARFVGAYTLRDGVHRVGNSAYFAERCTAKPAYWRRATRAEAEACEAGRT